MVGDEDLRLRRGATRAIEEAALVKGAPRAQARVAIAAQLFPQIERRREPELRAAAGLVARHPVDDVLQRAHVLGRPPDHRGIEDALLHAARFGDLATTQIVSPPLHELRLDRQVERGGNEREVLVQDLLLQRDGVRRDDDLLAGFRRPQDRRDEIREGLAGARSRFDEQHTVVAERGFDQLHHSRLCGAYLESGKRPGERSFGREEGRRFRHGFNGGRRSPRCRCSGCRCRQDGTSRPFRRCS